MAIWLSGGYVCAQPAATTPNGEPPVAEVPKAQTPVGDAQAPVSDAPPPTPEQECMRAHEQAQVLRLDGNLMQSKNALKACSLEVCPAIVQRDCVRWLDEVSTQIPTVVFEAITQAGAAQRVTVKQGGQVLASELDGRPLAMNPGYYEFSFELPGQSPKFVAVLLKQGEKNRLVTVDFREPPNLSTANTAPAAAPPTPVAVSSRPTPTSVYVLGGLSLVGASAATILGINTRVKEDRAYDECAPRCSEDRVDSIQRWALATDIAIGVTAVSAITAVVLYIQRPVVRELVPAREASKLVPVLSWAEDAAWAGVTGSFW